MTKTTLNHSTTLSTGSPGPRAAHQVTVEEALAELRAIDAELSKLDATIRKMAQR